MPAAGPTPFERVLRLLTPISPGEGRSIGLMLAQVFALLFAYYLIRPVREALILAEGTAVERSYAVGAVALALIFLIPLYQLLFDRIDGHAAKATMLRWVMAFFITNLLAFCALGAAGVPIAVPFFVWVGVFSVMLMAQFWAFASDLFDIRSGERLFAVIAVGSAAGAWSGSRVSGWLFPALGPYGLMLGASAILALVAWLSARVQAAVPDDDRAPDDTPAAPPAPGIDELLAGFATVLRSRYLLLIAVLVALVNWIGSTGGYILASFVEDWAEQAVATTGEGQRELIGGFYGSYFAWITLLQLLLQLLVVPRVIRHLGLGVAIMALPLVMVAGYGLMAWVPVFALVRAALIAENSVNYSLHATTCSALYLPLQRHEKYIGKTVVDTFFWRFGDLLQAVTILLATGVFALPPSALMLFNLLLALVALAVAAAIGHLNRRAVKVRLAHPGGDARPPTPLPLDAAGRTG